MVMTELAIGYLFKVHIDGLDLGSFTKVDGLGAKYDILTVKEGGENGFVHQLPGRLEYDNVKITRPVDDQSGRLAVWFSDFQTAIRRSGHLKPMTASIEAMSAAHETVATWNLGGVIPVRYSGPSFQAGSSGVLSETLEIAHSGFLSSGRR